MLSKCANPECSETFKYLHQGKIFCLAPTPEVASLTGTEFPRLQERFWLCDRCSKEMTMIWAGTEAKLVRLSHATRRSSPGDEKTRDDRSTSDGIAVGSERV